MKLVSSLSSLIDCHTIQIADMLEMKLPLKSNNHKKQHTRHVIFITWFGQVTFAYFHVVASQWMRVALKYSTPFK
jgi:hypothetical protein